MRGVKSFVMLKFLSLLKIVIQSIAVLIACNVVFSSIYIFGSFLPQEKVIQSLRVSQANETLKTPVGSVDRSPTGLGIDYGTECAALSIGLKDKSTENFNQSFLKRFYDGYLVSGQNVGVFDPCSGLLQLIDLDNKGLIEPDLSSYARNWWGISIFIQAGILLFGLATTKIYIYIALLISVLYFYILFSKFTGNNVIGILLLFPFMFFGDFQDLHNSFPFALLTIQVFVSAILVLNLIKKNPLSNNSLLFLAITLGSTYNFIFWLNFHLVLTFVPIVIFLVLFGRKTILEIYTKVVFFLVGYIFGFISTAVIKWVLSSLIYGGEIVETIRRALDLRLSSGSNGLNANLLDYASFFHGFPLPIKASFINIMVFASKFIDPRYASKTGLVLFYLLLLSLILLLAYKYKVFNIFLTTEYFAVIPIFLIPFIYFALTPNHSFNHAVLTYRAIPLVLGFLLSFIYMNNKKAVGD
jgi:hypothetical protein